MKQKALPIWGWIFVVICGAIPVASMGGAIPATIGAIGATSCYALARDGMGSTLRRVVLCCVVSVVAWCTFGGVVLLAQRMAPRAPSTISRSNPGSKTTRIRYKDGKIVSMETGSQYRDTPLAERSQEEQRRIYFDAIRTRTRLEETRRRLDERHRSGGPTSVLAMHVESGIERHESNLGFITKHYSIKRTELDALIRAGDAANWPATKDLQE